MYKITLDFVLDAFGEPQQEQLNGWLTEHAPTVGGQVLEAAGPAGGNAVVVLSADTVTDLDRAVRAYCGGDDEQADDLLEDMITY